MNKEQQLEEQLWSYIDGSTTAAEKIFVEQMLATHATWKAKYKEQLVLHNILINETELEQPSLRFTKNVMDGIAGMKPKQATNTYINKYIIRSIASFFIITISALLIYSFSHINWASSSGNTISLPFDTKNIQLPKYNFSKLFTSNTLTVILMITIILGLMLLNEFLRRKKLTA